jgi:hypothetical protein
MSRGIAGLACLAWLAVATWACGPRTTPPQVSAPDAAPPPVVVEPPAAVEDAPPPVAPPTLELETRGDTCAVIPDPGEPIATIALTDAVDPSRAPHPANDSERLLFRQLYETLVRVDCDGRVRPGLASSWRLEPGRRAWIVTLRENAVFSDGTPVTSAGVRAGWLADGSATEMKPQVRRLVEDVDVLDDRTMAITLTDARTDQPLPLAHTDLSVARVTPGAAWPLGTQGVAVVPDAGPPGPAGTDVIALASVGRGAAGAIEMVPLMRFVAAPGRDRRDLLDEPVDLLLTRDPRALAYAATLPQFFSVALPWHRTHVFLSPGLSAPVEIPDAARQSLAADAVRGESRGAAGPRWWQSQPPCGIPAPQPRDPPSPAGRIVYDAADPVARDLAERLVGLAASSAPGAPAILDVLLPDRARRPVQRAAGLTGEVLALALRRGQPLDPCADLRSLIQNSLWLHPNAIVPLVDTRQHAIVRRGRSGLTAEGDGLLIAFPSRDR